MSAILLVLVLGAALLTWGLATVVHRGVTKAYVAPALVLDMGKEVQVDFVLLNRHNGILCPPSFASRDRGIVGIGRSRGHVYGIYSATGTVAGHDWFVAGEDSGTCGTGLTEAQVRQRLPGPDEGPLVLYDAFEVWRHPSLVGGERR